MADEGSLDTSRPSISLVVSRFPKFTETFVVNEILALERAGFDVEIHPLLPPEPEPHQDAAQPLVARARFGNPYGRASLKAFVQTAVRQPRVIASILSVLARETWRKPQMLVKDVVLLPRICAIARELPELGIGHVHAHFATHAGYAAWCLGRLTGLPYSIVAHGSDVHKHQAMLGVKVAEAAFVSTVSEYNRVVITGVCDAESADRVVVVRSGVDFAAISAQDARPEPDATPVVTCVGTLHEVKGQTYLLRAIAELAGRDRDVRLALIGDGDDRSALEAEAAELGIADRVDFMGAMSHREVIERLGAMSVLVAPSVESGDGRKEGIPTVLLEAMAAGVPVVASDLAGIPELVVDGDNGLLVAPGDAVAIADAIDRLLTDRAFATELADRARAHVRSEFDVDATAGRIGAMIVAAGR